MSQDPSGPQLRIDVFSVFPELVDGALQTSIIGRARTNGQIDLRLHDPRDHATDKHRSVDDSPFGGGAGMVMMPEPVFAAVEAADSPRPLLYLGPSGRTFDQSYARELSELDGFSLLCGRYEGIDERIRTELCDGEISVGDVVLAGGELAALVVLEATARLVPGVLGNSASAEDESFADGLLEYPHFTRPAEFRGHSVPDVLLSGNHAKIEQWRRAQSLARTRDLRPDLLEARGGLTPDDQKLLDSYGLG